MSTAIANALAYNQDSTGIPIGSISEMRFGNGGTVVLSTGRITYKKPRVTSFGGLYSQTYLKKSTHVSLLVLIHNITTLQLFTFRAKLTLISSVFAH
ncbi:UNVERIFIED_ORG: hypothetical protein [Escherichia phage CMSTMSU]